MLSEKEKEAKEWQNNFHKYQNEVTQDLTALKEKNLFLTQEMDTKKEDFLLLQKQSEIHFKNIANQIFEQKVKNLPKQSSHNIETLLTPMKETFEILKKKISTVMEKHRDEQISLENRDCRYSCFQSNNVRTNSESDKKALKGDNKTQGDWGEMILSVFWKKLG